MTTTPKKAATRKTIHDRIIWQATLAKIAPAEHRNRKAFPDLWRLLESAKNAVRKRKNPGGRIVFTFAGKRYAARLTTFERIIVEEYESQQFLAASGPFSLDDEQ